MSTKEELIAKITRLQDEAVLEELLALLNLETDTNQETIILSADQKTAVDEGLKDIEEGRTFTDEEVRKLTDEWLRKK